MLIPRPSSGEANANGGVTEHELDDMLWAAVELTVADHFAVIALVLNKGKGRDKWPTRQRLFFLLAETAQYTGVIEPRDFATFQDHGYMGLYLATTLFTG